MQNHGTIRVCEVTCVTCVEIHKVNRKEEEWMQGVGGGNGECGKEERRNCDYVGKNN